MEINETLFLILIAIFCIPILGFIVIFKRYNNLKKENDRLKYIILKARTKTNTKDTKEQNSMNINLLLIR